MSVQADYARFFGRELATVRDQLLAYPDNSSIWALPNGLPNSAGTLALHIAGNLRWFIGAQLGGTVPGNPHLERITLDQYQDETARETMLLDMKQRVRDVRQGPDGLVYVLTDEDNGSLIRIEPAQ